MHKHYTQIGMAGKTTMTTAEIRHDIFEDSDIELDEEDSNSDFCAELSES